MLTSAETEGLQDTEPLVSRRRWGPEPGAWQAAEAGDGRTELLPGLRRDTALASGPREPIPCF